MLAVKALLYIIFLRGLRLGLDTGSSPNTFPFVSLKLLVKQCVALSLENHRHPIKLVGQFCFFMTVGYTFG